MIRTGGICSVAWSTSDRVLLGVRTLTFPLRPNEDGMRNPDRGRSEERRGKDPYGLTKQSRNAAVKTSWTFWHKMARVTGFR